MTPKLYGHAFSSYTQKALIAFYEKGAEFEFRPLSQDHLENVARWKALWPIERFPLLEAGDEVVAEASSIVEWIDRSTPGDAPLIPTDPRAALKVRTLDRIFDNYVMTPMQTIVFNRIRPVDKRDPLAVEQARAMLDRAYGFLDSELAGREWAAGEIFSLADCAAAPALFYADWVHPFDGREVLLAYYLRLRERPSFARCVEDGRPHRGLFPGGAPQDRVG